MSDNLEDCVYEFGGAPLFEIDFGGDCLGEFSFNEGNGWSSLFVVLD
jgi:hypothetical protein